MSVVMNYSLPACYSAIYSKPSCQNAQLHRETECYHMYRDTGTILRHCSNKKIALSSSFIVYLLLTFSKERLVNLEKRRERFAGLSLISLCPVSSCCSLNPAKCLTNS